MYTSTSFYFLMEHHSFAVVLGDDISIGNDTPSTEDHQMVIRRYCDILRMVSESEYNTTRPSFCSVL
ncbi:hypothetical protein F8M41_023734 [Gigaspora margarita]|uniref:Uncharacterized protein n=1 Tax=Gigaspora margarita TaxID=4874 RepID=A0A8H4EGQ6_GIGMA|nr:hypothetical protein F8M41_023734 [Gigaspora margarita]